jgi:hypothetical protein
MSNIYLGDTTIPGAFQGMFIVCNGREVRFCSPLCHDLQPWWSRLLWCSPAYSGQRWGCGVVRPQPLHTSAQTSLPFSLSHLPAHMKVVQWNTWFHTLQHRCELEQLSENSDYPGYGLGHCCITVWFPARRAASSILHSVYTGCGSHPELWGLFPRGQSSQRVNLTTHLHLVPKLRMCGAMSHFPMRLHGMILD